MLLRIFIISAPSTAYYFLLVETMACVTKIVLKVPLCMVAPASYCFYFIKIKFALTYKNSSYSIIQNKYFLRFDIIVLNFSCTQWESANWIYDICSYSFSKQKWITVRNKRSAKYIESSGSCYLDVWWRVSFKGINLKLFLKHSAVARDISYQTEAYLPL